MAHSNSDFSSKPKYYSEYYRVNSIPDFVSIEKECLETPEDTNSKNTKSSVKEVMCALSIVITLIVASTWQLYRSIKVTTVDSPITSSTELPVISSPETK